jgi:tRNA (cmo5U34)-methyltransferase
MTKTDMIKDDIWKSAALAKTFLSGVRGAMPLASEQIEVMLRIISMAQPQLENFLDLGCGDGILGRAILAKYPQAKGVFLDFSEPMLEAAKIQVQDESTHQFLLADFGNPEWTEALKADAPFDAIVSGFAIHHQPDDRKKEIYRSIYQLLKPGGIFINVEHVSSPTEWVVKLHDEFFIDYLAKFQQEQQGNNQSREEIAQEYYYRPDKAANILAPVETQCDWLRELGFQHVDCYFKLFELAIFGGIRSES